jgi:hypothetical protein
LKKRGAPFLHRKMQCGEGRRYVALPRTAWMKVLNWNVVVIKKSFIDFKSPIERLYNIY